MPEFLRLPPEVQDQIYDISPPDTPVGHDSLKLHTNSACSVPWHSTTTRYARSTPETVARCQRLLRDAGAYRLNWNYKKCLYAHGGSKLFLRKWSEYLDEAGHVEQLNVMTLEGSFRATQRQITHAILRSYPSSSPAVNEEDPSSSLSSSPPVNEEPPSSSLSVGKGASINILLARLARSQCNCEATHFVLNILRVTAVNELGTAHLLIAAEGIETNTAENIAGCQRLLRDAV
ncbi:hypothetical protein FN846DRAFT_903490 [Sphaerosporella brunnea]|uniref:Uncharacterized protein n=1 Tax=Sphaerosporella brunnea TaxID=1250544 RepID=A0A5J5F6P0_9PEZI|nr:hypothetical protein FN846DRAFT_903490 [Sphaerosporella brunnea]